MIWDTHHLEILVQQIWESLLQGCDSIDSPLRTAVLGTGVQRECALRVVIVRSVLPGLRQLACFSDFRAAKIRQIQAQPRIEWLFYDPRGRVQIIASATAQVFHADARAQHEWQDIPVGSRLHYCAELPPGSELPRAGFGLPLALQHEGVTVDEVEEGFANFAVIECEVDRLEWLQLTPEGPLKAEFHWREAAWQGQWLVP